MILDGKKIAQEIFDGLRNEIQKLSKKPKMVTFLIGNSPASLIYIKQKKKWAQYVGIDFILKKMPLNISEKELIGHIQNMNNDITVNGYIIQLPLPKHININSIIQFINPEKDIDGFTPLNIGYTIIGYTKGLIPCTPNGIMEILKRKNIVLKGKIATIIGRSNIVGKPITYLLMNQGVTVINCNFYTNKDFMKQCTLKSDIIIVATGVPHLLKADMVNKNAVIIDVGITKGDDGKLYGDTDYKNLIKQGNFVTPVPGGVGPVTIAMLMKNNFKAYKIQNKSEK